MSHKMIPAYEQLGNGKKYEEWKAKKNRGPRVSPTQTPEELMQDKLGIEGIPWRTVKLELVSNHFFTARTLHLGMDEWKDIVAARDDSKEHAAAERAEHNAQRAYLLYLQRTVFASGVYTFLLGLISLLCSLAAKQIRPESARSNALQLSTFAVGALSITFVLHYQRQVHSGGLDVAKATPKRKSKHFRPRRSRLGCPASCKAEIPWQSNA